MAKKPLSIWIQLIICVGLGAIVYGAWQEKDSVRGWLGIAAESSTNERTRSRAGVPVILAPVGQAKDVLIFQSVGTGDAKQSVLLRAEVPGRVVASELLAGRHFKKGDVLLRLDDSEQQLALRLAETRLKDAERNRDRLEQLRATGTVSESAFDNTSTAAALAELEFKRAQEAVMDRVVHAPFDGVAGLPSVEEGDRVDEGDQLASFDDRDIIMVEFDLPETVLTRLNQQSRVTATSHVAPGRVLDGEIESVDSRLDPTTRSAKVRVSIDNDDDLLRPGASFSITLELPGKNFPVVPELALQFSNDSLYVWRVKDGEAERVDVDLVRRRAAEVLVDGPLDEGDAVVIEGTQRLSPGRAVNVIGGGQPEATQPQETQVES